MSACKIRKIEDRPIIRSQPGDESESTFLHVLSASKNPEKHKLAVRMIKSGANLSICDAEGNTPLHLAVKSEAFCIIEAILILKARKKETFNFLSKGYRKFIELVFRSPNFKELIDLFCEYCHLNIYRCCDCLPWDMSDDHLSEVVKWIFRIANEKYDLVTIKYLFRHVLSKNFELIKVVSGFKKGKKIKSSKIQKPLSYDFVIDNPDLIVFFVREGANINDCVNDFEQYALHKACANGKQETVELLLRFGADVNVFDRLGETPFSMCTNEVVSLTSGHECRKVMIKHFACLTSSGIRVNEHDLSLIRERPDLQKYYTSCIEELGKMKTVPYNFLYDSLFRQTSSELSLRMRNNEFFRQLRKILLNLLPNTFPIFEDDMMKKFQLARDMRNIEVDKEREMYNTFNGTLPYAASSKIARHTLDLVEKEFTMCRALNRIDMFDFKFALIKKE